jgi:ribosomal protein S27E
MKVDCISCEGEVNLDHSVFEEYEGSVKCFSCGAMLEIRTSKGVLGSIKALDSLPQYSPEEISPNCS